MDDKFLPGSFHAMNKVLFELMRYFELRNLCNRRNYLRNTCEICER